MRVFLSWSGTISRELATALHGWIPLVVQCARPFISTGDIDKGKVWSDVLSEQLSEACYGIVCVTRDNYTAPWLHFEAGAISRAIDKSYVSPLLFDIKPTEISGPLGQFQLTVCSKDDILNLMRSINSRLDGDYRLSDDILTREFEKWWPDLKEKLDALATKHEGRTHTAYPWLYTTEDLTREHRAKAQTCVWWITPNPFEYVLTPTIKECVRDCIMRNVKFTFIIPEDTADDAKPVFKKIAADKSDGIKIVEIPGDDFRRFAVTDYIVVDPDAYSTEVYLELPVEARGYWVSVVRDAAGNFVRRFRSLAKEHGTDLPSSAPLPGSAPVVAISATADINRN